MTLRRGARAPIAILVAAGALAFAGCSAGSGTASDAAAGGSTDGLDGSITVFAAASLQATFAELAERFEAANPRVSVELTFAGSSQLVTQLVEGAPGDVVASADETNMTTLVDEGLVDASHAVDVATNTLRIAVPPGNPAGVEGFGDLADAGVKTVVCAPQVPCGAATAAIEEATGVDIPAVSEESSVTDVLGKVTSGEADAGLVYVTDVIAAGDAVEGIAFPEADGAVNVYPVAPLEGAANPEVAEAFVAFVAGEVGRDVLDAAGFGAP
jgi:molybdate transport system substrate-binding protein